MKKFLITVGGKEVPCRLTMGAMLQFKRTTGRDISQMENGDLEDLLMLMWCCICCACRADGYEYDVDFEQFACLITPEDVTAWNRQITEGQQAEKKTES